MRHSRTGRNHLSVFGILKGLAGVYNPQHIVMDATGVGEGLWAMLDKAFPTRVIPVKFSRQVKSEIGWMFLSIIETGRFEDVYSPLQMYSFGEGLGEGSGRAGEQVHPDTVRLQYSKCESTVLPGPQKTLRWGVPDGTRGPDGQLVHDDFLLADSLVAILDRLEWVRYSPTLMVQPRDPLEDMDRNF